MSNDKLKPCPFCGGIAEFERTGTNRRSCIVSCIDCGTTNEGPDEYDNSGHTWNTRTPDTRVTRALESIKNIMYVIDSENINIRSKPIMQDLNDIKEILEEQ